VAYWWVNLRKTFRIAVREGFMWCPSEGSDSRARWHWLTMHGVVPGDLVFANWDAAIRAIGIATSHSRDAAKPRQGFEFDWQTRGWRVDVDFHLLTFPIETRALASELARFGDQKYSPVSASGRPVQAYLSGVNQVMATLLIQRLDPIAQRFVEMHSEVAGARDPEAEDERHERELSETPTFTASERTAVIQARRGQGAFRLAVEQHESRCKVTGLEDRSLLHACHIKPWRVSTPREKLDGENGFLLSPHVHLLFDRGLISFDDGGRLLLARTLKPTTRQAWALDQAPAQTSLTERQNEFLEFHRQHVFSSS